MTNRTTSTERPATVAGSKGSYPYPLPDNPMFQLGPGAALHSLTALFERQVIAGPDRLAVGFGTTEVSYAELNAWANRIAHALLDRHDGRSPTVALLLQHGPGRIASALGVLKAGLGYVALDAIYHDQGLTDLVVQSQSGIILADAANFSRAQEIARDGARAFDIDQIVSGATDANLGIDIPPESLALLRYTSGSTGKPKGVIYTHRATVEAARRNCQVHCIDGDDRVAFLDEFWLGPLYAALLGGASLHPLDVKRMGVMSMPSRLLAEHITKCPMSTTAFRQFAAALDDSFVAPTVRQISIGGEQVLFSDFTPYRKHFPNADFGSAFGASEFNGIAGYRCIDSIPSGSDRVPAGFLNDGVEVLVLGEDRSAIDTGEIGEVAIRSDFHTDGYWSRPDLTAQTFVPDPERTGHRLYLTGDLGRFDEHGCLYLFGRADHQMKVRGHRILPPEIEDVILAHEGVKAAAVASFSNKNEDTRLAAYIVPHEGKQVASEVLRSFLRERLPDYMVPSVVMAMDALPQTPTGKIDRRALPRPETVQRDDPESYVAPRDELEEQLVALWEEHLGVGGVGVEDDFFTLGGDSLQATRLLLEVNERFDADLTAEAIFDAASTIRGMAREIALGSAGLWAGGDTPDIDFVEFNAPHEINSKAELFHIDPETSLRLVRPNMSFGKVTTNALGFRGPDIPAVKPKDTVRMAFLGSSDTFDAHTSGTEKTWPHVMWMHLTKALPGTKIDYINAGQPGYGTRRMEILYRYFILPLDPDVVVISASDMNADTAYLAREAGIYDGVHYRASGFARRSALCAKVEMNLVILWRLLRAHSERGKLRFDEETLTHGFEERFEHLVRLCQRDRRTVALLTGEGRLRRDQSWLKQLRNAITSVLYMPFLSITGMLTAGEAYRRAVRGVAERTGVLCLDVKSFVPPDGEHYVDSNHYSDAGSAVLGEAVASALADSPEFCRSLRTDRLEETG